MTGKIKHAHIVLSIAESHDLAALNAEAFADACERFRLADAFDRRFVEPRCRLYKGKLFFKAAADVCKARHENLVWRSRQNLDRGKTAHFDGIRDIFDNLDSQIVVAALILHFMTTGIRRENGFAIINNWRKLWISLKMAQKTQCRPAVNRLRKEDFPRRRILDLTAVIREQQAVVLLELKGIGFAHKARCLTPRS